MKKKNLILICTISVVVIIAILVFIFTTRFDTTLEFKISDKVSKAWVWNAEIKLENRFMKSYYQSDRGLIAYTFTHLKPGSSNIEIQAPSYENTTIPVKIGWGKNTIKTPIELTGYEIPGIAEVFVYKDRESDKLLLNPRAIDKDGKGIGRHPCLDMWFGIKISVQVKNGVMVREPVETGSERGEELFRGKLDWEWDSNPDTYYRYISSLDKSRVKKNNAPYNVYDYIVAFRDPRKISKQEMDEKLDKTIQMNDPVQVKQLLDGFGDKIIYFLISDWNQPAL
jgi:hypothetical protein